MTSICCIYCNKINPPKIRLIKKIGWICGYTCAKRYIKQTKCKHKWCNFEGCLICGASPKKMEILGYNLKLIDMKENK